MGFYKDGKYVYEPMDAGNGVCDQETYNNQQRKKQEKIDQDNAGMDDLLDNNATEIRPYIGE